MTEVEKRALQKITHTGHQVADILRVAQSDLDALILYVRGPVPCAPDTECKAESPPELGALDELRAAVQENFDRAHALSQTLATLADEL